MAEQSSYTSVAIVAAGVKLALEQYQGILLDYGGGRFDLAIEYAKEKGSTLLVFDPYNRTPAHNQEVMELVENNGIVCITCCNVLNVIINDMERYNTIGHIYSLAKKHKCDVIFQIYEGDKKGTVKHTSQLNQPTKWYVPTIEALFMGYDIKKRGKYVMCSVNILCFH